MYCVVHMKVYKMKIVMFVAIGFGAVNLANRSFHASPRADRAASGSNSGGESNQALLYVTAKSGLVLRAGPGPTEKKLATLPYGSQVHVIEYSSKESVINGKHARWARVSARQGDTSIEGWCFSAYIMRLDEKVGWLKECEEGEYNYFMTIQYEGIEEPGYFSYDIEDKSLASVCSNLKGKKVRVLFYWSEVDTDDGKIVVPWAKFVNEVK